MAQNANDSEKHSESSPDYVAVDPVDLERGDRVIVHDVDDGETVRGTVEDRTIEWGRVGITVLDDDGAGWTVWEETGRTWTRVEDDEPEIVTDGGRDLFVAVEGIAHVSHHPDGPAVCGYDASGLNWQDVGGDDPLTDYPDLCGNCRRALVARGYGDDDHDLVTDGGVDVDELPIDCGVCGARYPPERLEDDRPQRCEECGTYGEPSSRTIADGGEEPTVAVPEEGTGFDEVCPECGEDIHVSIERWASTAGDSCPHCEAWINIERTGEERLVTDGGRDAVDELEIAGRSEETVEERRAFVRSVLDHLEAVGGASRSEILDDLDLEDGAVGYGSGHTLWKKLLQPALSELAEVLPELESPGARGQGGWRWSAEDLVETPPGLPDVDEGDRVRVTLEDGTTYGGEITEIGSGGWDVGPDEVQVSLYIHGPDVDARLRDVLLVETRRDAEGSWSELTATDLDVLPDDDEESHVELGPVASVEVTEELPTPAADVETLRDQIRALEVDDVIRLEGYSDGEGVETDDLRIVKSGPRRITVESEGDFESYDVEEVKDGVIGTIGKASGNLVVTAIELVDAAGARERREAQQEDVDEAEEVLDELEDDEPEEVTAEDAIEAYVGDEDDSETLTGLEELSDDVEAAPAAPDVDLEEPDVPQLVRDLTRANKRLEHLAGAAVEVLETIQRGDEPDEETAEHVWRGIDELVETYKAVATTLELSDADFEDATASRALVVEEISELLEAGMSPPQALDYYVTEGAYGERSRSAWAEVRGTSHQAVSYSVGKARDVLEGED